MEEIILMKDTLAKREIARDVPMTSEEEMVFLITNNRAC